MPVVSREKMLTMLGVPDWLQHHPKEVWIRLKTENAPPYNTLLLDRGLDWRVVINETNEGFEAIIRREWQTGGWVSTGSSYEGPGWGYDDGYYEPINGYYEPIIDHKFDYPIGSACQSWSHARGGWPLPGDTVICELPEGILTTKIVRCVDNGFTTGTLFEITGGRQVPVGCMKPMKKND